MCAIPIAATGEAGQVYGGCIEGQDGPYACLVG